MSCFCLAKLRNLILSLLPLTSLNIRIPPLLAQLNETVGPMSAMPNSAMLAQLRLAAQLKLPLLPLSLHQVEQIAATASACEQLTAVFGPGVLTPAGMSRLAVTIHSLNLNWAALLPLTGLPPPGLLRLSHSLGTIATLRTRFGIDLLAPKIPGLAVRLNAALQAGSGPTPAMRFNAAMMARLSAYARLSAAAQALGGLPNLIPTLQLVANLRLPVLQGHLMPLAYLAALLGASQNIQAVLGISPFSAALSARLRVALLPLEAIPPLNLGSSGSSYMTLGMPSISANFSAQAAALANLNLRALVGLKLPNLAPLALVANLSTSSGAMSSAACSSSCPVGSRLAI